MLRHQMTKFELSNNQHSIIISSRVVDQVKGLIRISYFCVKQLANAILRYSLGSACIVRIAQMEGEEIFGSCNQKANLALE